MIQIRIGEEWRLLKMGQIERILQEPQVIMVPKAPPGVAGLILYQGQAVCIHQPEDAEQDEWSRKLAVLIRTPEGTLTGVLAEEIAMDSGIEEGEFDQIFG